jgi:hypothetical protein
VTAIEIKKNRFEIAIEAFVEGCYIPITKNKSIILSNTGEIFEQLESNKKTTIKLSNCTILEFLKAVENLSLAQLKKLYGDTRLYRLQKKLTKLN